MTLFIPFENPPDLLHLLRDCHSLFLLDTFFFFLTFHQVSSYVTQSKLIENGDTLTQAVIIQNDFFCSGCFHLVK